MKINDKNLTAFAISANYAPDKEGWLMKKGDMNKGFQKRWFVLKRNLLFYFEKRSDKEPLGAIILEGCTIGKRFIPVESIFTHRNILIVFLRRRIGRKRRTV